MSDFLGSILGFIKSTQLLEQFEYFDAVGLFTNPWFLVPFIGLLIYYIIKQQYKNIILVALGILVWVFLGSSYVAGLIDEKGFIQLNKILPIIALGVGVLSVVIYIFFMRSD